MKPTSLIPLFILFILFICSRREHVNIVNTVNKINNIIHSFTDRYIFCSRSRHMNIVNNRVHVHFVHAVNMNESDSRHNGISDIYGISDISKTLTR